MDAKFTKNDQGFICECCGANVKPLKYSSRDHCPECLVSLHVDINPGDRKNLCKGLMIPTFVKKGKKGYIIEYKCTKCNAIHNNISAEDDNFETLLKVMNHTYQLKNNRKP